MAPEPSLLSLIQSILSLTGPSLVGFWGIVFTVIYFLWQGWSHWWDRL